MTINKSRFGKFAFAMLIVGGLALAPSAFARGHISVGINVPGLSIGYWGGSRWHDHAYVGIGYGPTYYSGYYAPAWDYDDSYYGSGPIVYYSNPGYYGSSYYDGGRHYRRHYRDYDRGYYRDYGRGYYRGYRERGYRERGYRHREGRRYRAHDSYRHERRGHYDRH